MADEGFHEIQLNGKQLVFLFMAATVVAVVIFLCGVMVGRGIRAPRPGELTDLPVEAASDPTLRTAPATPAASAAGSAASDEDLSYPERLAEAAPPPETLTEPSAAAPANAARTPAPTAGASEPPPQASAAPAGAIDPTRPSRDADAAPALPPAPSGDGFTVQVAAVRERTEADTIARRLVLRGYPAYVMAPASGAPRVFRVRVGKFRDRRDAEAMASRLEKQEQFKPWITR